MTALSAVACSNGHISAAHSAPAAPASTSDRAAAAVTTTTRAGSAAAASKSPATTAGSTGVTAPGANSPAPAGGAATPSSPQSSGSQADGSQAPKPAAAGTYQERQSGSFTALGKTTEVPPQGTLVVAAAQADGTQVWHRYVQQGQSPNDTTLQFDAKGIFLLSTTEQSPQGNVACNFDPAVPAPPWPAAVGASFSSTGNCGKFTVSVSGRITGQQSVVVGGTSYDTWVVETSLKFQGEVTGTGTQEDWYSPTLRIPLEEKSQIHGSYGPVSFASQLSSEVTSLP